jgi:uncharacterized membrane protein YphA (DoxX/SURF4 family)
MLANFIQLLFFLSSAYFAAVLTVSAVSKLRSPRYFIEILIFYGIRPRTLAKFCAWLLIGIELALAMLLVSGYLPALSSLFTLLLFCAFFVVKFIGNRKGQMSNCGCFGEVHEPLDTASLIASLIQICVAAIGVWVGARLEQGEHLGILHTSLILALAISLLGFIVMKRVRRVDA